MVTDYSLGDIITLKKKHPCGELIWKVDRIGADIGIVCQGCNRRLIIARSDLEKRTRSHKKNGMSLRPSNLEI